MIKHKISPRLDAATSIRVPKGQIAPNSISPSIIGSTTMSVIIDMSGVNSSYTPAPAGTYEVTLGATELKSKKDDETSKYVKAKFVISDETFAEADGKVIFANYSLKNGALWKTFQDLVKLGVDPEDLEGEVDIMAVWESAKGRKALASVSIRKFTRADGSETESNEITNLQELTI